VLAYLGVSSLKEFEYAKRLGKRILFLESWGLGYGINSMHMDHMHAAVKHYGVPSGFGSPIDTSLYETVSFSDLLGPGGRSRSAIIEMVREREAIAIGKQEKQDGTRSLIVQVGVGNGQWETVNEPLRHSDNSVSYLGADGHRHQTKPGNWRSSGDVPFVPELR